MLGSAYNGCKDRGALAVFFTYVCQPQCLVALSDVRSTNIQAWMEKEEEKTVAMER